MATPRVDRDTILLICSVLFSILLERSSDHDFYLGIYFNEPRSQRFVEDSEIATHCQDKFTNRRLTIGSPTFIRNVWKTCNLCLRNRQPLYLYPVVTIYRRVKLDFKREIYDTHGECDSSEFQRTK